jgi:ABC-type dipeptide/oligopeptide/nickel transport system permease component
VPDGAQKRISELRPCVLLTLSTIVIVIYALASLGVDLSYAWLDPRIRVGGAA